MKIKYRTRINQLFNENGELKRTAYKHTLLDAKKFCCDQLRIAWLRGFFSFDDYEEKPEYIMTRTIRGVSMAFNLCSNCGKKIELVQDDVMIVKTTERVVKETVTRTRYKDEVIKHWKTALNGYSE